MAAVALLTFIGAGVWLVLERCTAAAVDTTQRMRAFEIARENMEKLLGSSTVEEMTEYGISEEYPDIRWQTTVESFYEPTTSHLWVRGVCSSEYTDSQGTPQTVELTNWLTTLSDEQMKQLSERAEKQKQMLSKHILATEDLAAEYAGVASRVIEQWAKNGMPMTADGEYLKPWLDLYLQTNGNPTQQDRESLLTKYPELSATRPQKAGQNTSSGGQQQMEPTDEGLDDGGSGEIDPEIQKIIDQMMREQESN